MATTWNPSDKSANLVLSNGNLSATSSASAGTWVNGRANDFLYSGKRYFEASVYSENTSGYFEIGFVNNTSNILTDGNRIGSQTYGWSLLGQSGGGHIVISKRHNNTETELTSGEGHFNDQPKVFQVAIDFDTGKLWFGLNNTWYESGNPAAGTNPSYTDVIGRDVWPAVGVDYEFLTVTAHFNSASLVYSPPSGFDPFDYTPPTEATVASTLEGAMGELTATAQPAATLSSALFGATSTIEASVLPPSATISATLSGASGAIVAYMPVLRYHQVYYTSALAKLHSVSYSIGTIPQRFHQLSWGVEAQRLHALSYEVLALVSAERLHSISYNADQLTTSVRLHEVIYEGSGVNPLVADYRLHEISYSVVGTDPLIASVRLHEVLYEGSGIGPLVLDQRLHEINYAVIGTNQTTSSSSFHQVFYTVFTPSIKFNEIFYKSVILNDRLHLSGWIVDTSQYRIHESRYHVVDTSSITEIGTITFSDSNSNTYDFLALTITADEDSPYWQCEVSLKDAQNYILFQRDTPFIISLLGTEFYFIVDSRTLQRTIDDAGNYQEVCTLSGLSPLVRYASPRATKITKTWETPTLASAIVAELLGSVTWNLVDWMIPAYRLAADHAAPLDVARQIVEAVGGLIESQPSGSVVCRHRWPTSIAELGTAAVDHTFDERFIFSASEEPTQDELIDKVRIYDTEAGFQDRLEYVPNKIGTDDDPRHGILYAFPSPWREGLRMVTTRPSTIYVGTMTEGTRAIVAGSETYPPELLTFTERTASTQYPIMSLTTLDWLDEDLGTALFTPYATTLEAGAGSYSGYSLAEVQYVTRYLAVPVTCLEDVEEIEAQFLLLEETQDG